MPQSTDLDLNTSDLHALGSLDAIISFFNKLGYATDARTPLTPEAIGLAGDSAAGLKKIELLSEDTEGFLRVVFAQSKTLTAKVRNDLARVLGRSTTDHLIVLTSDYSTIEFVLIDKRQKKTKGPVGIDRVQVVPKTISVNRRTPTRLDLRIIRRLTWTCQDALDQFDKLRSVFDAAACTGQYFQNRGLFSDYYLRERLREDSNWRDNPSAIFSHVRDFMHDAAKRWTDKDKDVARKEIFAPLFKRLGFKPIVHRPSKPDQTKPDYLLKDAHDNVLTAAFVYQWDRWLDGPDLNDPDTPEENPGACVVSALDEGIADWIIVTNGHHWRLYGKQAHARSTNFYEVDLVEALLAAGDTDPNEAFRYWWLFFRPEAFTANDDGCWLDVVLRGSRDYAKRLGDRLKDRVFLTIFPHLAQGFLQDRKKRLGVTRKPTAEELDDIFEATLTFLYRLLFLLYAESRHLVPINEAPYQAASLKHLKEEIGEKAGVAESEVADKLSRAYSDKDTTIYDSLAHLFHVMAEGDASLNVPKYNGGLFNTTPIRERAESDSYEDRSHRIGQFLIEHKIPDRQLALAVDRLARDQDERTLALVFIDYKSLEVRHLGSIYEGLLEFKLKVAAEDLTTKTEKGKEKFISLSEVAARSRSRAEVVVKKNAVYLSNDKAERKATGSYYTPDPIVEYIVANTVGPVLDEKLEALRADFRKVRKTFDNEVKKARVAPIPQPIRDGEMDERRWASQKTFLVHKELVERLFDLHVCDPAMGSGHFLVEVVDFVTDRLLKFLNQFPINPVSFALDRTRTSIIESLGEQGVTVDPANLTDINLLKRHVLKRCVYGVDINPMAVELAKVSLWLDCFTLGAPLNFLDHHLRCGNSLIGARFADLFEATSGRLFKINYEPLLRAINHVLQVSKLADATAAEVASSVSQYDVARSELTGYQVILDLLVAKYFDFPGAQGIVEHGQNIQLSTRNTFLETLEDDNERQLVLNVEKLAKRPDRRFFHWEIEFPEIFFGFIGHDHRQIRHKDGIATGSAGFDCIVGNPPYGVLDPVLRPFIFDTLETGGGKPDIYAYFIEKAALLVCSGGRTSFIAPNTWLTLKAFSRLRHFLLSRYWVESILDTLSVFEDAWVNTAVVIITNQKSNGLLTQVSIPSRGKNEADQLTLIQTKSWRVHYETAQADWDSQVDHVISYNRDPTTTSLISRIERKLCRVRDFYEVTTGYQVYHNTRHTKQEISNRVFHKSIPSPSKNYRRCFSGTDVSRYWWGYSSDEFVLCADNLYRSPEVDFFERPKVLIQEIFGRGEYKVSAAVVADPVYYDKSCLGAIVRPGLGQELERLSLLLAFINSRFATWYFLVDGNKSYGTGDFARLTKKDIADFPFPRVESGAIEGVLSSKCDSLIAQQQFESIVTSVAKSYAELSVVSLESLCQIHSLVEGISRLEGNRERSPGRKLTTLCAQAAPMQACLDRIVFAIVGLNETVQATIIQELKDRC